MLIRQLWRWGGPFTVLGVLAVGSVGQVASTSRKVDSAEAQAKIVNLLNAKNWKGIYQLASANEQKRMGMNATQFSQVMDVICEGFPSKLGCVSVLQTPSSEADLAFVVKMTSLKGTASDVIHPGPAYLRLGVNTKGSTFSPVISTLPFDVAQFQKESKLARRKRLVRAMESAHVNSLYHGRYDKRVTLAQVRLAAKGKLDMYATLSSVD